MDGILTEHLSKSYLLSKRKNLTVLKDISLHLAPGSFTSLVGESGCGKSTLARILAGLEHADSGTLMLDGDDATAWTMRDWRSRRKKVQAVLQDTTGTLNPMLSTYHNVEQALVNLTDMPRSERRQRILSLMEQAHMDPRLLKVPVRHLSGGEQRRLSLLRAMAVRPDYLILDEVLSGLDLISADAVMTLLKEYHQKYHCTFLLITHEIGNAYRLSDRIYEMRTGQIVRQGINTTTKGISTK